MPKDEPTAAAASGGGGGQKQQPAAGGSSKSSGSTSKGEKGDKKSGSSSKDVDKSSKKSGSGSGNNGSPTASSGSRPSSHNASLAAGSSSAPGPRGGRSKSHSSKSGDPSTPPHGISPKVLEMAGATPSAAHSGAYSPSNKVMRKGNAKGVARLFAEEQIMLPIQEQLWLATRDVLRDWSVLEPKAGEENGSSTLPSLVNSAALRETNLFLLETGRNGVPFATPAGGLDDDDFGVAFYPYMFSTREGVPPARNFLVTDVPNTGSIVATVAPLVADAPTRVMIRSKFGVMRLVAPPTCKNIRDVLASAHKQHPRLRQYPIPEWDRKPEKIYPVTDPGLAKDLMHYEDRETALYSHYKVGVLYVKKGQTDENQMFSNTAGCRHYDEFLSLIGERIELKSHLGYTGGLDARGTNTTGTHSIYTTYKSIEVMFHVATMLPNQQQDLQRIEKKRHLGNDVVQIVFLEAGAAAFDPRVLTNQFNHVFVIVQPVVPTTSPEVMAALSQAEARSNQAVPHDVAYRVCVVAKAGVEVFGPYVPFPAVFGKDRSFREWLLQKVVNGERAAMYAQTFKANFTQTRRSQLDSLALSFKPDKNAGKSHKKHHLMDSPMVARTVPITSSSSGQDLRSSSEAEPSEKSSPTPRPKVKKPIKRVGTLRSAPSAAQLSGGSMKEVVEKGKLLLALSQSSAFDAQKFRQALHDIFLWTSSREAIMSAGDGTADLSRVDHNEIVGLAGRLVKDGNALADLREQLRQGFSCGDGVEARSFDMLKISLAAFFACLKRVTNAPSPVASGAPPVNNHLSLRRSHGGDEPTRARSNSIEDRISGRSSSANRVDANANANANVAADARARAQSHVNPNRALRRPGSGAPQLQSSHSASKLDISPGSSPDGQDLASRAEAFERKATSRVLLAEKEAAQARAEAEADAARVKALVVSSKPSLHAIRLSSIAINGHLDAEVLSWDDVATDITALGQEVRKLAALEKELFGPLTDATMTLLRAAMQLRESSNDIETRRRVREGLHEVKVEMLDLLNSLTSG